MSPDRAIASAKRLIAANGEACVWTKPAPADPAADPWRETRAGAATTYNVAIAWFSPRDAQRGSRSAEFLALLKGTEVPTGTLVGLMAGGAGFTPEKTDTVTRSDGSTPKIDEIDLIGPSGVPVLWFISVKR